MADQTQERADLIEWLHDYATWCEQLAVARQFGNAPNAEIEGAHRERAIRIRSAAYAITSHQRKLEAAEAECARLREALTGIVAEWREHALRARPLDSAPLTAEKRARVAEWMFYTNRANEVEAALASPVTAKDGNQ